MSTKLPSTMKALIKGGWTGLTFSFSETHPVPKFDSKSNANDVLLQVHAAAMNPVDYKLPRCVGGAVAGIDVCGTVHQVGAGAQGNVKVGDVVVGPAKMPAAGSMAEFTVVDATKLTSLPPEGGWTVEEGAAIPTAYDTAVTAFAKAGMVKKYRENPDQPPVESLLVIGASGGCGVAALQLAKGMGIPRIIGICSSKNAQFCKDNGATEIVPYDESATMEDFFSKNAGQIPVIYDTASYSGGGENYSGNARVLALLKDSPREAKSKKSPPCYLVLNGPMCQWVRTLTLGSPSSDPRMHLVLTEHSRDYLSLVFQLLDKANLKPVLDSKLSFTEAEVLEGYKKLKSRRAKGKIVVKVSDL